MPKNQRPKHPPERAAGSKSDFRTDPWVQLYRLDGGIMES